MTGLVASALDVPKVVVEACLGRRITCCATSDLIQPATQKDLREYSSAGVQWRAERLTKCSPVRRSAFLRRGLLPLQLLSKAKRPRIRLGVRMRGLYAVCRYVCGTRGMREKANSKKQISEHSPSMCDYAATVDTLQRYEEFVSRADHASTMPAHSPLLAMRLCPDSKYAQARRARSGRITPK